MKQRVRSVDIEPGFLENYQDLLRQCAIAGEVVQVSIILLTGRRAMEWGKVEEEETLALVDLDGFQVEDLEAAVAEAYRQGVKENPDRTFAYQPRIRYELQVPIR